MSETRPNVLFVFADQLAAVWTGCCGNPDIQTPNLDRLCSRATRFDRCYTASPLCTPYRGALLTGRYPSQTGIDWNERRIPAAETTLADLFNAGGYRTCYVGKWHLSGPPQKSRWVPPVDRGGFADFVGWESYHVHHWNNTIFESDSPDPIVMDHDTDGVTDFALSRLRKLAAGHDPFCLFVAHQAPHPVCKAPEAYRQMYRDKQFHWRPSSQSERRFDHYGQDISAQEFMEEYAAEVTHLDAAVGRLLDELESLHLADETLVVFTSDHGEMASSHGRYEKRTYHEEAIRVPLIVHLPGQLDGRRSTAPVSTVDFLPTLLEVCQLPQAEFAEGVSFAGQLRDVQAPPARQAVFSQLPKKSAILEYPWTLELSADGREVHMLLDIEADPAQATDFQDDPAYAPIRDRLADRFRRWLADIQTRLGDPQAAGGPERTDAS